MGYTIWCEVELAINLLCMWYTGNVNSIFSRNFEANASKFLENLEENTFSAIHV